MCFLWFILIFWVILGGVSLLNFFWFEPSFLSYRTTKLQKSEFWWFSRHLNSMKFFFLQFLYFVNFSRSKKSTIRYKIVFLKNFCSGGGQKTRFWPKTSFFAATRTIFFKKNDFISYSALLTRIKVYKKNFFKKKFFSCCLGDLKITKIHFFAFLTSCNSKTKARIKKSSRVKPPLKWPK